jgi:hypothetical protein
MQSKENNKPVENLIPGYLKDELSAEEIKELISWIKEDSSNKRYFDEYCEIWITTRASLKNSGYNFQEGFWKFKQKIQTDENIPYGLSKPNLFRTILRYAAIFIAAFSLSGILFYYLSKNQTKYPA